MNSMLQGRRRTSLNYPLTIYVLFIFTLLIHYYSIAAGYVWKFPGSETVWIILGTSMMICGLYIIGFARASLAGYWGTHIYDYGSENRLIVKGIYKNMRHPVYLGQSLMTTGTVFMFDNLWLLFFPILTTIVNVFRAVREDLDLAKRFGNEFENYRAKTSFWGI
jgi:protein-S-isoprenylcysteine O-methyltransferase Ste14